MRIPKSLFLTLVMLATAGLLDSGYLAWKHYSNTSVICRIIEGCDRVLASVYATIGGIPTAFFGFIYYGFLLYLLAAYLIYKNPAFLKSFAAISAVGFLASLWFLYLQIFVIQAFCFYCLISAATATAIFVLSLVFLFNLKLWKTK